MKAEQRCSQTCVQTETCLAEPGDDVDVWVAQPAHCVLFLVLYG